MAYSQAERRGVTGALPALLLKSSRPRIALAAALSSLPGFALAAQESLLPASPLPLLVGILLLSGGASLWNNLQDRQVDRESPRTRSRPLPSGRLHPLPALLTALLLTVTGVAVLFLTTGFASALLGAAALLLYNGLYTPLKRKSPFAFVPGALVGALPPLMGYAAAGGDGGTGEPYLVAGFYFLWQIPHTLLLFLLHGEGYASPHLPALRHHFREESLLSITLVWVWATAVYALLLPLLPIPLPFRARPFLWIATLPLLSPSFRLIRLMEQERELTPEERHGVIRPLFLRLNHLSFATGAVLSLPLLF